VSVLLRLHGVLVVRRHVRRGGGVASGRGVVLWSRIGVLMMHGRRGGGARKQDGEKSHMPRSRE